MTYLKLFVCDSGGTIMTAVDFQNKNRFQVVRYHIYFWDGARENSDSARIKHTALIQEISE